MRKMITIMATVKSSTIITITEELPTIPPAELRAKKTRLWRVSTTRQQSA